MTSQKSATRNCKNCGTEIFSVIGYQTPHPDSSYGAYEVKVHSVDSVTGALVEHNCELQTPVQYVDLSGRVRERSWAQAEEMIGQEELGRLERYYNRDEEEKAMAAEALALEADRN